MATYKTVYEAVMEGMRGEEIADYEFERMHGGIGNARSVLRVIRCLTYMERGDVVYVTANLATGLNSSYDTSPNGVIRQAQDVHPDNKATAYEVKRTQRGYSIRLLYASS